MKNTQKIILGIFMLLAFTMIIFSNESYAMSGKFGGREGGMNRYGYGKFESNKKQIPEKNNKNSIRYEYGMFNYGYGMPGYGYGRLQNNIKSNNKSYGYGKINKEKRQVKNISYGIKSITYGYGINNNQHIGFFGGMKNLFSVLFNKK